jgi:cell division transport system permease protein
MSQAPIQSLRNIVLRFFKSYGKSHLQAAVSSLRQLSRMPLNSVMTSVVIGVALALPMALYVILQNLETLTHHLKQNNQITVYLKSSVTDSDVTQLVDQFRRNKAIAVVKAVSPAEGLEELQGQAGLNHIAEDLPQNPLPWALVVFPKAEQATPENLKALTQMFATLPDVDSVQLDTQWTDRLFGLLALGHRFLFALTLFLGIGVFLIVNNCIRSATQSNKKEIDVIRFIGGTNSFIKRPFLYVGMIYGLLGGIVAWQLVDLMVVWLRGPAAHLGQLYQSPFALIGISVEDTFLLLISSMAVGVVGAWFAVNRHMKTISS